MTQFVGDWFLSWRGLLSDDGLQQRRAALWL